MADMQISNRSQSPKVSFFKNCVTPAPESEISFDEFLHHIKTGTYGRLVRQYLELKDKKGIADPAVKLFKRTKIPAITYAGIFTTRSNNKLITPSNITIFDVDHYQEPGKLKEKLMGDQYVFAAFVSPSGDGLKILVQTQFGKDPEEYKKVYFSLIDYFSEKYRIPTKDERTNHTEELKSGIDLSCSDLARLCILSSDPDIYTNPKAVFFKPKPVSSYSPPSSLPVNHSQEDDIRKVVEQIEQAHLDITNGYANWLNIGFALHDALGTSGRGYFHKVSQFSSKYKASDCDKQYDQIEKSRNSGITIKTFFQYARESGIDIRPAGKGSRKEPAQKPKSQQKKTEPDSEDETGDQETTNKRKLTSNKFILASAFIKEHYQIRNNIVTNEYECREIGEENYEMLNENNIFIKMQFSNLNISLNNLVALLKSNLIDRFDPFKEYFGNLPAWDQKVDYITTLAQFVKTKDRNRFDLHFKKWLVRVVACALNDSFFNKQAFILVHDRQNSGKSTFCRFLCPSALSNYIAENLSIDKDSRILLTRNLLINLDELSTLSKVEINSLKSLFSKDKINDRLPYDRRNSIIPRRCSFIGSTNQTEFLNDESGSVRWLCFVIDEIDWDYKNQVDIDLVYSQAYHLYRNGFEFNLTQEEIRENEEYNKQFQLISSERELVSKFIRPGSREVNDFFMTATDILMNLTTRTENKIKLSAMNIGKAMKFCGIERVKHSTQKVYGYYVKIEG
ncbi:MAG: PriCT-2 domain-containing protein [Bacteroidales bacterium]|nr:PriCT-2 domain-containing protein [Bacteroidales bacterium]